MRDCYPIGAVARLYFNLVATGTDGGGRSGQSPTIAIQRVSDGQWFDASSGLFKPVFVTAQMLELDATNLPGRYYFDFDHAKDRSASAWFSVKMENGSPFPELSYRELYFGAWPAFAAPRLCAIQGALFAAGGEPLSGALVQATLVPVFTDVLGRGYQADAIVKTYSAADGSFELPVVQGATIRFEIRAIGYDRRALVPNQSSVLFTQL